MPETISALVFGRRGAVAEFSIATQTKGLDYIDPFSLFGPMAPIEISIWYVLVVSGLTAVCTGFGIVPFLFVEKISARFLGVGNSIAAGLMMGASIGLVAESYQISASKLVIGLLLGGV